MSREMTTAEPYRVEISGWDVLDNFFVETTRLERENKETKRVRLQNAVKEGAVVFMRLLESFGEGRGLPIACSANATEKNENGAMWVELVRLPPRCPADSANAKQELALQLSTSWDLRLFHKRVMGG